MRWIILLLAAAGAVSLVRKCRSLSGLQYDSELNELKNYTAPVDEPAPVDDPTSAAVDEPTPGELQDVLKELDETRDPLDRHALFSRTVDKAYKGRSEKTSALILATIAERHIKEFPVIKPKLAKQGSGALPRVPTFQKYATFLAETDQYERAIAVCQEAIDHHLDDGTKGGFKDRILRISKKRDSVNDS